MAVVVATAIRAEVRIRARPDLDAGTHTDVASDRLGQTGQETAQVSGFQPGGGGQGSDDQSLPMSGRGRWRDRPRPPRTVGAGASQRTFPAEG